MFLSTVICMHTCMRMYVCMYVCMYSFILACVCMYLFMHVCMCQVPKYCLSPPTKREDDEMQRWIHEEINVRCHLTRLGQGYHRYTYIVLYYN